jgi:hypothetical protein
LNASVSNGIVNTGTIVQSGGFGAGIEIASVSAFAGGISNTNSISGAEWGILLLGVSNFSGGITNFAGGVITGHTGIDAALSTSFSGGIVNAGRISATGSGIVVAVSHFSGGITNSGTVMATANAISATAQTFSGGILNTGTLTSANDDGISISSVSTFSGNPSNAGTITAKTGIKILSNVTFAAGAAIVNSGTISGSTAAIDVSAATSPVTINQTGGLISGEVKLSSNADVLNISSGTISGSMRAAGQATRSILRSVQPPSRMEQHTVSVASMP